MLMWLDVGERHEAKAVVLPRFGRMLIESSCPVRSIYGFIHICRRVSIHPIIDERVESATAAAAHSGALAQTTFPGAPSRRRYVRPPSLPLPFPRSSVRVRPSEDPFPPFLSDFPFRARCPIVAAVIIHSLRQSVQDSKRVNFRPTYSHPPRPADSPPFPALLPVTRPLDDPFVIFLY